MNVTRTRRTDAMGIALLSVMATGCVGLDLFGVPLGPRATGGGLVVQGTKLADPTLLCVMQPGPPYYVSVGRVDLGQDKANGYTAFLEVKNNLVSNDRTAAAPPYGNDWGSTSSNQITLVGASITYEFPGIISPAFRLRHQQRPSDGVLFTSENTTNGIALSEGTLGVVGVEIMTRAWASALVGDSEFLTAQENNNGQVRIIARITLEGRTGAGGRVPSNEYSVEVVAMDLTRPPQCASASLSCPAPVCLPGQDDFLNNCPITRTNAAGMPVESCP